MAQSMRYHTETCKGLLGKEGDKLISWGGKGPIFDQGLSAHIQKDTSLHLLWKCNYRRGRCVKLHTVWSAKLKVFGAERECGFIIFQEGDVKDLFKEGSIRGMHTGAVKGQEINIYTLISFCLIYLDENIISAKMVATCLSNAGGAILHRIVG